MTCPICHAEERLGVRLPKLKARIFDLIKAAGDVGISSVEVSQDIYDRPRQQNAVRMHVHQINDLLAATDWRIVSNGRGIHARWFLWRRRVSAFAAPR